MRKENTRNYSPVIEGVALKGHSTDNKEFAKLLFSITKILIK